MHVYGHGMHWQLERNNLERKNNLIVLSVAAIAALKLFNLHG